MEFKILGPLEVIDDGRAIQVGGRKQRAVLAVLLLHANEVVSRGRLIEAVWGERAPPTAQRSLDSYVSRLRALLGQDRVVRQAPGYLLHVEPGELDLALFERLVSNALEQRPTNPQAALSELSDALALWRGPALADLLEEPFAQIEAARLEEQRVHAEEERLETRLVLGDGPGAVPDLQRLVQAEPLRERPRAQLMLALYQSGRAAEALELFQAYRRLLADELGLEPGPQLRDLQRQILSHDSSLAASPARGAPGRRRRRPAALLALAAALIVGAAATVLIVTRGASSPRADASSPSMIELGLETAHGGVRLDASPAATTSGAGSLWVTEPDAAEVVRIDPRKDAIIDRIPIVGNPGPIAYAGGAIWVTDIFGARVLRIDPSTDRITQTVDLGSRRAAALAADGDRLWVADQAENALIEIDANDGKQLRTIDLGHRPSALLADAGTIWVASYDAGVVDAIASRSGDTVATLRVGNGPTALARTPSAVWVANSLDSTVSRIDPSSGLVAPVIPVGSAPSSLAVSNGSIWIGNEYGASVTQVDPDQARVKATTAVGGAAVALASVANRVWVGIRPLAQHRGGTLVLLHQRPLTIDPAIQLDLPPAQSDGLTRDSLVTFDHAGGTAGASVVPDLAVSVPAPTDSGRTYTFRLRPNLRYSNGQVVRAADFRRAIERVFFLGAPTIDLFKTIAGTNACGSGATCDLSHSIVTDERARTVSYHLARRDSSFLFNLTSLAAAPIPPSTLFAGVGFTHQPIPGTGPYRVASATSHEIRYVRNRFFHEWSHAAQPDGNPDTIVMRFGLTPAQEATAVANGKADWTADQIPPNQLPAIARRYGNRLHSFANTETDFYRFNTFRPPFNNVKARRAVNFALDRARIAKTYGGPVVATPTCQVLPPGIAGYTRYCPYTTHPGPAGAWRGPDLARAKTLVAESHTYGAHVSLWGYSDDPTIRPSAVHEVALTLRRLGYRVHVRLVPHSYFDTGAPASAFAGIDMLPAGWLDVGPDLFFRPWVSCSGTVNRFFCDRHIDDLIQRAADLESSSPRAAAVTWAAADHATVDAAAWLPFVNPRQVDFLSARVNNFQHHPYWDILVDQLWIDTAPPLERPRYRVR